MRYETVKQLKDEDFKRLTEVSRAVFARMLAVVQREMRDFGRPPKFDRADPLLMTLMYWREYRTEFHTGITYGVSEATMCRTIQKVENVLMQSGEFRLPGKKALQASDTLIEVVLIDATEQPIERPPKSSASTTAAKKKRHTQKARVIVNQKTRLSRYRLFHGQPTQHDFQLFKESSSALARHILSLTYTGYSGINKLHSNSHIPAKKLKLHPLTPTQKDSNRRLPKQRILVELELLSA